MPNAVDPTGLEEKRSKRPSQVDSMIASISATNPMLGYVLDRQKRFHDMIGEAAISKYENWRHHYVHGGRYRIGGMYGEHEGVAEAAAHLALLGDSETMGLHIIRSGTFAYGFLLRRDEEAGQLMAYIPKSRAEYGIDAAKNYGREKFFGCLLEDETVMRDLEAGNAVGQDKFQIAATIVSALVLEPMLFARLGSMLNWVRSTATFRRLASIPGLRYLDDAARLATKSQVKSRGAQLRERLGDQYKEYVRFREQGFTPAQSKYLTQPYGQRAGHHFPISQRTGRDWNIPRAIMNSKLNVLRPKKLNIGRFYELHYRVDRYFHGTRFPKTIGGVWRGNQIGLTRYSGLQKIWYATPGPLKISVGLGAGSAAATGGYWWLSEDSE